MTDTSKKSTYEGIKTSRGFSVIDQSVYLDFDVENDVINGYTEISIVPHTKELEDIRINSRSCEITSVTINHCKCAFAQHDFMNSICFCDYSIPSLYMTFLRGELTAAKTGELFIRKSPRVTISRFKKGSSVQSYQEKDDTESVNTTTTHDNIDSLSVLSDSSYKPDMLKHVNSTMSTSNLLKISTNKQFPYVYGYKPLLLAIRYQIKSPKGGIFFNTNDTIPSIYTWNSLDGYHVESNYGNGTRTWVPCIDDNIERYTWNLYYHVPKGYTVYSSGSFIEKNFNQEKGTFLYHYSIPYPTVANNIGFFMGKLISSNEYDNDYKSTQYNSNVFTSSKVSEPLFSDIQMNNGLKSNIQEEPNQMLKDPNTYSLSSLPEHVHEPSISINQPNSSTSSNPFLNKPVFTHESITHTMNISHVAAIDTTKLSLLTNLCSLLEPMYNYIYNTQFLDYHDKNIPILTTVAYVHNSPSMFAVYPGLILIDDSYLIDTCDTSSTHEYLHTLGTAIYFMLFGSFVQTYQWTDLWIPLGYSSYLSLKYIQSQVSEDIYDLYINNMRILCIDIDKANAKEKNMRVFSHQSTERRDLLDPESQSSLDDIYSFDMNDRPVCFNPTLVNKINDPKLSKYLFMKSTLTFHILTNKYKSSLFYNIFTQYLNRMIYITKDYSIILNTYSPYALKYSILKFHSQISSSGSLSSTTSSMFIPIDPFVQNEEVECNTYHISDDITLQLSDFHDGIYPESPNTEDISIKKNPMYYGFVSTSQYLSKVINFNPSIETNSDCRLLFDNLYERITPKVTIDGDRNIELYLDVDPCEYYGDIDIDLLDHDGYHKPIINISVLGTSFVYKKKLQQTYRAGKNQKTTFLYFLAINNNNTWYAETLPLSVDSKRDQDGKSTIQGYDEQWLCYYNQLLYCKDLHAKLDMLIQFSTLRFDETKRLSCYILDLFTTIIVDPTYPLSLRQYAIYCLAKTQNNVKSRNEPLKNISIFDYIPQTKVLSPLSSKNSSKEQTTTRKPRGRGRATSVSPSKRALSVQTKLPRKNAKKSKIDETEKSPQTDLFASNYSLEELGPSQDINDDAMSTRTSIISKRTALPESTPTSISQVSIPIQYEEWSGLYRLLDLYYHMFKTERGFVPVNFDEEEQYIFRKTILTCLSTITFISGESKYTPTFIVELLFNQIYSHTYISTKEADMTNEKYLASLIRCLAIIKIRKENSVDIIKHNDNIKDLSSYALYPRLYLLLSHYIAAPTVTSLSPPVTAAMYARCLLDCEHTETKYDRYIQYTSLKYDKEIRKMAYFCLAKVFLLSDFKISIKEWFELYHYLLSQVLLDPNPECQFEFISALTNETYPSCYENPLYFMLEAENPLECNIFKRFAVLKEEDKNFMLSILKTTFSILNEQTNYSQNFRRVLLQFFYRIDKIYSHRFSVNDDLFLRERQTIESNKSLYTVYNDNYYITYPQYENYIYKRSAS